MRFSKCIEYIYINFVTLDGKHIAIKGMLKEGSFFYNYKGFHSVILLAVVDANYKFIMVDVGTNGRANDAGTFRNSSIGYAINNDLLNFPDNKKLPKTNLTVKPLVFLYALKIMFYFRCHMYLYLMLPSD